MVDIFGFPQSFFAWRETGCSLGKDIGRPGEWVYSLFTRQSKVCRTGQNLGRFGNMVNMIP